MRRPPYPIAFLVALTLSLAASASPPQRFPNILLVTVDTLRTDRLSGYGYGRNTSPNMDEVFERSALFTEARCVEPLTGPSLTSMMTSLHPHEHGATRNGMAMRAELPSLPKVLQRRGFETAAVVSNWTLKDRLSGLGEHFSEFREVFTRKRWFGLLNDEATAEDVTRTAIEWIDEHHGRGKRRPFFAWVHYVEPHAPYLFQRDFARQLGLDADSAPPRRDRYDTEVAFVDAAIGKLVSRVRQLYPEDSLLIVLTADHGENLGEHGYWGHGRHLWEENLRIPMALAWEGTIAPARIAAPASNLDLGPTILGLLGLPVPETFKGYDWSASLQGEVPPPGDRVTHHQAHKGAVTPSQDQDRVRRRGLLEVSLVGGGRKETLRVKGAENRHSVFRLGEDPGELTSLVRPGTSPSEELSRWLEEVHEGLEAADSLPTQSLDDESLERLRSLGYLD